MHGVQNQSIKDLKNKLN